jgi:putative peptide zinc metalloprotease protein
MSKTNCTASDPRAPRKQVRIQLRRDLSMTPQRYEGRQHYVIKDPVALRYWRFEEREQFLCQLLDGQRTLEDVRREYETRFRPQRLSLEEIETFARQLVGSGLAHPASAEPGLQLLERHHRVRRARLLGACRNLLAVQVPLFDPDRLLTRMLPGLRWLCSRCFFGLSIGLVLAALLLVATHFDAFRERLPAAHDFFGVQSIVYLWLALALVKVVHEFGHGLSCKALGGEVHEMGFMFLCFTPCLYCNVTDSWRLPKWQRMAIGFAGIHVELLIAALATFFWWHSTEATFGHQLCLSLMLVCSVNTLLLNGNPLLRYDGYYVLADWLEVPNLRERAVGLWQRWLLEHGLGVETTPTPASVPWRRGLLALYGVASYIYRWIVTFVALWLLGRFLRPYKLGSLAALLVCFTIVGLVAVPMVSFVRRLWRQGRLPRMKSARVTRSAGLLLAGLAAFFLMPLPIGRIRQIGLIAVRPDAAAQVYVPASAVLQRLHVREGQRVQAGDVLAEFRSLDLENQREDAVAEHEIRAVRFQSLRELAAVTADLKQKTRIEASLAAAAGDRARAAGQVELLDRQLGRLQIRAPRAGVVMALPRSDAIGKLWDKDTAPPVCTIGDPDQLWVEMPLGPADYRLLRDELATARGRGQEIPVAIRMRGRTGPAWAGHIAQLPEAEAKEIPLPLAQSAGGPVPVKSGSTRAPVPLAQQYLVAVALENPDAAVAPGCLAQVSVHCRWRSAAWWAWRSITSAFDLKLAY